MSTSLPSVSVIVPARGAAGTIAGALESITAQDYPGSVEVLVAVPPDDTDTRSALADPAFENVTVVDNPTGTTPAALNAAIGMATGDVVVRCDAHSVLPADYVRIAVETLAATGADNVGGVQDPRGSTWLERAVALTMQSPIGSGGAEYRSGVHAGPTDTVYLGVYRRSVLEDLGGFDETMIRNQDYELNWRIRESGGTVWLDPRLRVGYRPRGSLGALWRQYFAYGAGKRRMLRLHPRSLRARQLAAPGLVVGVLVGGAVSPWLGSGPLVALVGVYGAALALAAATGLPKGSPAVALPVVAATMHLAWGAGFLFGRTPRAGVRASRG